MAKLKQHHKDRLLLMLGLGLLLLLLLWWLAAHYHWGPYRIKSTTPTTSSVKTSSKTSSTSGRNGTNGTNGASGSSTTTTSTVVGTPIFNLYGSVHNGQTKASVGASAGGMNPTCVSLTGSTPANAEEVCTYQSGSQVVNITYLNGSVVSISKSGF